MTLLASALIGTWRLERWEIVYEDGRPAECPLGEDAVGLLMYTDDGHVSASLARAERAPSRPPMPARRRGPSTPTSGTRGAMRFATEP
jgi:hypothetical protein